MRLVLLGPPGCGKGTQAVRLAEYLGIPAVSTGEIFREAAMRGTALGREASGYMNRGELVPDELTIGILRERIQQKDCAEGSLLDGFPRTLPQAEALKMLLSGMGKSLGAAVNIDLDNETIVERLSQRRVCDGCGKTFHLVASPPPVDGRCDACGGRVIQRLDDEPGTILRRLEVYREQTAPLIEHYRGESLLKTVDGHGSVEEIQSRIRAVLAT
ncbi:MAG: adenylate kinase [Armatimonadetes bacterium CG2_30_59_28]|nr:adenylate kinase [Armatimonadota bacterium]OIO92506.1 MAG: adenylate kinase [Armatimonadetes bacterium CG2_30_59_28]PIU65739.1 MAG: adenylate kinase [Armatimonadetes bacterium CG07_land_8_20_14_0_80_59_28]